MGYSERICQLCGVSFNLGRIRTADEPEEAAWLYHGGGFISASPPYDVCDAFGCSDRPREYQHVTSELEHIAGPDCTCNQGYAGSRITRDEMKERVSVQCLAPKKEGWEPELDDEDFEIAARYCFLTGISSKPPDEFEAIALLPLRHGVTDIMIDNSADPTIVDDDGDYMAMPLHPACFQIFKRQSLATTGAVDIDGLWKLRELSGDHLTRFKGLSQRPDVKLTNSIQNCECYRGTEYLASTPSNISALDSIISGHMADEAGDTVFKALDSAVSQHDLFGTLSRELELMLLPYLSVEDVANLRLASPCFVQLPQTYFRNLVLNQMPWVWEAESLLGKHTDWHELWNELATADGGSGLDEKQRQSEITNIRFPSLEDTHRVHAEIEAELGLRPSNPKWHEAWQEKMRLRGESHSALVEAERQSGRWRPKKRLNEIKGLRNRRRIWEDIAEVVRRISELTPVERGDESEEEEN